MQAFSSKSQVVKLRLMTSTNSGDGSLWEYTIYKKAVSLYNKKLSQNVKTGKVNSRTL